MLRFAGHGVVMLQWIAWSGYALAVLACARGEAVAPERVEPAYLRNNVALTIAEQQALRQARK